MATLIDPKVQTAYSNTDWEQYIAGRPEYPDSLIKLILEYSRSHGAGRHRMVDIGAGAGVASLGLAPSFEILHLSDPSPANTEKGPSFVTKCLMHKGISPMKVETSTSVGEEAYKHIPAQSADLVISGTAAHFMDPDGLVDSAARILKPGGTLAIFMYLSPYFPGKSEAFHKAFLDCSATSMGQSLTPGDEVAKRIFDRVACNIRSGRVGLDSIPLKSEFFADPIRYRFNPIPAALQQMHYLFPRMGMTKDPFPSRVSVDDTLRECFTPYDPEADGWSHRGDLAWLDLLLNSMKGPGRDLSDSERLEEPYKSWQAVFDEECPDGTLEVAFPGMLIMGSRK